MQVQGGVNGLGEVRKLIQPEQAQQLEGKKASEGKQHISFCLEVILCLAQDRCSDSGQAEGKGGLAE